MLWSAAIKSLDDTVTKLGLTRNGRVLFPDEAAGVVANHCPDDFEHLTAMAEKNCDPQEWLTRWEEMVQRFSAHRFCQQVEKKLIDHAN